MNISPIKNSFSRFFSECFSENDALYLQDIFLTPGIHQINADSVVQVRTVVSKVLNSLQYHQNAACLSLHDMSLPAGVTDIVRILITDDHLIGSDSLMLFFLDHFYFDFLWIEESQSLLDSIWYEQFQQHLIDFNFNKSIPIIKIAVK